MGTHQMPQRGTPERRPNQPEPAPTYANIYVKSHSDCARRETRYGAYVDQLGDVRRCDHGKVQILMKPDRYARLGMAGPATWFWATLHPVWDFGQYWKAVKAMA